MAHSISTFMKCCAYYYHCTSLCIFIWCTSPATVQRASLPFSKSSLSTGLHHLLLVSCLLWKIWTFSKPHILSLPTAFMNGAFSRKMWPHLEMTQNHVFLVRPAELELIRPACWYGEDLPMPNLPYLAIFSFFNFVSSSYATYSFECLCSFPSRYQSSQDRWWTMFRPPLLLLVLWTLVSLPFCLEFVTPVQITVLDCFYDKLLWGITILEDKTYQGIAFAEKADLLHLIWRSC